jgi:hypothetical protein
MYPVQAKCFMSKVENAAEETLNSWDTGIIIAFQGHVTLWSYNQ